MQASSIRLRCDIKFEVQQQLSSCGESEAGSLRSVLPDKAVGVLIGPSLPGVVGSGEEEVSTGGCFDGANGPFAVTLPYDPGVDLFWSVTRYGATTFLPLDPATIGGNDIHAYNALNTEPDADGNVTITFSMEDPDDGTYWMPVTEDGYYWLARYYGPTSRLNGNTAKDIISGGTALAERFATVKF